MNPIPLFSDRERFVLIQEIGKMEDLSFGARLELLEQLTSSPILSPVQNGENSPLSREPLPPGYIGRLSYQVSERLDLYPRERRILMHKLAVVGLGKGRTDWVKKKSPGILSRLLDSLIFWSKGQYQENDGGWDAAIGLSRGTFQDSSSDVHVTMGVEKPRTMEIFEGVNVELQEDQLNRAFLGDEIYENLHRKRADRGKDPRRGDQRRNAYAGEEKYLQDGNDRADARSGGWFWGLDLDGE